VKARDIAQELDTIRTVATGGNDPEDPGNVKDALLRLLDFLEQLAPELVLRDRLPDPYQSDDHP
jgi:hypothetical protein